MDVFFKSDTPNQFAKCLIDNTPALSAEKSSLLTDEISTAAAKVELDLSWPDVIDPFNTYTDTHVSKIWISLRIW